MKTINIKTLFLLLAGITFLSSCTDFLKEENRQSLTDENAFTEPAIFDQFVVNAYGKLRTAVSFTDPDLYGTDIVTRYALIQGADQLNDYVNISASHGAFHQFFPLTY